MVSPGSDPGPSPVIGQSHLVRYVFTRKLLFVLPMKEISGRVYIPIRITAGWNARKAVDARYGDKSWFHGNEARLGKRSRRRLPEY